MAKTLTIPEGGRVVSWGVNSEIPRSKLQAAGLPSDPPRAQTQLHRAIAMALPKASLYWTTGEKATVLVDERRSATSVAFTVNATLQVNGDAEFGFDVIDGMLPKEDHPRIAAALAHVKAHADTNEIGKALSYALTDPRNGKGAPPMGAKGGAYILSGEHAAWWDGITAALAPEVDCHAITIVPDATSTASIVAIHARAISAQSLSATASDHARKVAQARVDSLRASLGEAVKILDEQAAAASVADMMRAMAEAGAKQIADESL